MPLQSAQWLCRPDYTRVFGLPTTIRLHGNLIDSAPATFLLYLKSHEVSRGFSLFMKTVNRILSKLPTGFHVFLIMLLGTAAFLFLIILLQP